MTDHQPEGTQLVTQLGDAVGGPEVPGPDPETETVDLRRKVWNLRRLGESMAEDRDETVRRCGEQVLAVLGDAAEPDELAALRRSVRILAGITARNHQVMEAARIEMGQNGPHAAMQWILNSLPDVWDDPETEWDGKESAEAWFDRTEAWYRAAESDSAAPASDDTGQALPSPVADSGPRTSAVPVLPVAAALDREAVREIARMAIGRYWNHDPLGCDDHPAAERVTEAFWPLLEHAQEAAAGSHEGVRLWMLDCGELVAKHRERAEAAERKLAEIEAHCRKHAEHAHLHCPDLGMAPVALVKAADILAIIGTREEAP